MSDIKKDLHRVQLQANRCISNGLDNSVKLKIANKIEIAKYKSLLENGSFVSKHNKPWTTLQVFDIATTRAHIKA